MATSMYVLTSHGETMNPAYPQGATYFDDGQTAYVLFKLNDNRTRPTRVMTSFGPIAGVKLSSELDLYDDQSGKWLGRYRVDGIHHFATGELAGVVPDRNDIKHCVVK